MLLIQLILNISSFFTCFVIIRGILVTQFESSENSDCILKGLDKSTIYQFRISAKNSVGTSSASKPSRWITTLRKDPEFIPVLSVLETTDNSITLVWSYPPQDTEDYIDYYEILIIYRNETQTHKSPVSTFNVYKVLNLEHRVTNYQFYVAACSNYTKQCGPQSPDRINDVEFCAGGP